MALFVQAASRAAAGRLALLAKCSVRDLPMPLEVPVMTTVGGGLLEPMHRKQWERLRRSGRHCRAPGADTGIDLTGARACMLLVDGVLPP